MSHAPLAGRIGPNAVIRLAEAAADSMGPACRDCVFRDAGLARYLEAAPDAMVVEDEVVALYAALAARAGARAPAVAADAGRRTGDYLLANRIPKPVQWVLKRTPPAFAARVLLSAIGKHAWTFAGTGAFEVAPGPRVTVRGGPFDAPGAAAEPLRAFYAAVFERLFRALVSPATQVSATAEGGACAIDLSWRRKTAAVPLPKAA
jgi:divinyl protochlorophyllide a 8-vinyl-reductase